MSAIDVVARGLASRAMQDSLTSDGQMQFNFFDYLRARNLSRPKSFSNDANMGVYLQDFLMWCQRKWYDVKGNIYVDSVNMGAAGVVAVIPVRLQMTIPLIVPDRVRIHTPVGLALGATTGGTLTDFYEGDPTAQPKALANPCMPMVMIAPGGSYEHLQVYGKSAVGSCSGQAFNKDWTPSAVTVKDGGSGYVVGDLVYPPHPHAGGYTQPVLTVASVDGNGAVTGLTLTTPGSYGLPPAAQRRYWTAENGYTGQIADWSSGQRSGGPGDRGTVFDASGNYITRSNGAGVGLTIDFTWIKDFAGAGADFRRGSYAQVNAVVGSYDFKGGAGVNHATYGKDFGWTGVGLQIYGGAVVTQGAYYGIDNQVTDSHFSKLCPIQAKTPLSIRFAGSQDCGQVTLDTWDVDALLIDNGVNTQYRGKIFHNSSAPLATTEPIKIGSRSTNPSTGMDLHFMIDAGNALAASAAALSIANARNSRVRLDIVNKDKTGAAYANPISKFVTFGANLSDVVLEGTFDEKVLTLSDTLPPAGVSVTVFNKKGGTFWGKPDGVAKNAIKSPRNVTTGIWEKGGSVAVASGQTGRNDRPTATLMTITSSGDFVRQAVTATSAQEVYAEAIIKPATVASINLLVGNATATERVRLRIAPATGTIEYASGTGVSNGTAMTLVQYGVDQLEDGWLRMWLVAKGVANPYIILQSAGPNGTIVIDRISAAVAPAKFPPNFREPPIVTANVATIAATIAWCEVDGQELLVTGTASGKSFVDRIVVAKGRTGPVSIVADAGSGSPDARTYSQDASTGAIFVAMAAGSYTVTVS